MLLFLLKPLFVILSVTDSEASAEDIFDVKFCRSKLAEHYKKTATVPTSVWSKNCLVDIHQIYTRLSWVKEEQTPAGSSRSELKHYTDVFTVHKNGVVPKRILVQGQTGIGKSTFVKKLAVDWAELDDATTEDRQKGILKTFELLVVVNLKEVSKCQSLKDIISRSSIFAREEKYLTDSLLNYITNNQDKVLLVFDGYDEYRCGSNSEIYQIFSGNELRNCCVLITTRISKADELRAFKDLHAEITGFGEEDRNTFMSRMLGGTAEAEELSDHLDSQNLHDLARVPLLLLFFCTLWKKGKSESFPESKTKLYSAIVQYVLDYNQGKDSPARFGRVDDFKEVLAEIGKVALECLLRDDHVFEYDQLSDALRRDESLIVGLLQVTEYAENLRPAGMVCFIHKSIQEFLAAWFVTYRCVPERNLGGIEQHARTLDDCEAWENVLQFVCGLSDDGAVKVFQHFTSVRISDPTLDLSKTIPDEENEPDVPLYHVTYRHERFRDMVDDSFKEVQSKAALVRHWLVCNAGIILITPYRPFPKDIPKLTLINEVASSKDLFFHDDLFGGSMPNLYEFEEFVDCFQVPLRITENSAAPLIGDFLRLFKTVGCDLCNFNCVLRFHDGKAQFYITKLDLCCDDHARLFTGTITISTPSRSAHLCSKQSCLKFLRSLTCFGIKNAQNVKDLGVVIRNCKHLKTIELDDCGDGVSELLDQVPNPSMCSLSFTWEHRLQRFRDLDPGCPLKSFEAELAGVFPRFNVTALNLELDDCCAAAVNRLCSITHQTLKELTLRLKSVRRAPAAPAALSKSLSEMSSLKQLELIRVPGTLHGTEEIEELFGGINRTLRSLQRLTLWHFDARGSLAPLTKRFQFFPNLFSLSLLFLNMDERDLRGLLESITSFPNLKSLDLNYNPLGSQDRVESIVKQALPQVDLNYY